MQASNDKRCILTDERYIVDWLGLYSTVIRSKLQRTGDPFGWQWAAASILQCPLATGCPLGSVPCGLPDGAAGVVLPGAAERERVDSRQSLPLVDWNLVSKGLSVCRCSVGQGIDG